MRMRSLLLAVLLATSPALALADFQADEATAALQSLAAEGNAEAQFYLGHMYYFGDDVKKDLALAASWFRKAAEQGNATAQFNLGVMYRKGLGVSKDAAQAVIWYRKAAEQGDAAAQLNLGEMYYNGQGVPDSTAIAYALFNLAQAAGDKVAAKNLRLLRQVMSSREVAAAQQLSRQMAQPGQLLAALDRFQKTLPTPTAAKRQ